MKKENGCVSFFDMARYLLSFSKWVSLPVVVFSHLSDHNKGSHQEEKDCKDMFRDFFSLKKSETATSAWGRSLAFFSLGSHPSAGQRKKKTATI